MYGHFPRALSHLPVPGPPGPPGLGLAAQPGLRAGPESPPPGNTGGGVAPSRPSPALVCTSVGCGQGGSPSSGQFVGLVGGGLQCVSPRRPRTPHPISAVLLSEPGHRAHSQTGTLRSTRSTQVPGHLSTTGLGWEPLNCLGLPGEAAACPLRPSPRPHWLPWLLRHPMPLPPALSVCAWVLR